MTSVLSHLLQMRGLKQIDENGKRVPYCRIFYRCVDWNFTRVTTTRNTVVASFTDAWIETDNAIKMSGLEVQVASFTDAWIETTTIFQPQTFKCRIFYRCVDWNRETNLSISLTYVASFTDAWIETPIRSIVPKRAVRRIFYRCVDWNLWPLYKH